MTDIVERLAELDAAMRAAADAEGLPTEGFSLADEAAAEIRRLRSDMGAQTDAHVEEENRLRGQVARLREQLRVAREALESGDASDGYHTHRELYEYRMLYNAHAARGWVASGIRVVKSRRHSDGEPCFGGGWFIVVAELPTGQVSNHYRDGHLDLFDVPEVDLPPEYDGHSPQDAADRLLTALKPEKPHDD